MPKTQLKINVSHPKTVGTQELLDQCVICNNCCLLHWGLSPEQRMHALQEQEGWEMSYRVDTGFRTGRLCQSQLSIPWLHSLPTWLGRLPGAAQ